MCQDLPRLALCWMLLSAALLAHESFSWKWEHKDTITKHHKSSHRTHHNAHRLTMLFRWASWFHQTIQESKVCHSCWGGSRAAMAAQAKKAIPIARPIAHLSSDNRNPADPSTANSGEIILSEHICNDLSNWHVSTPPAQAGTLAGGMWTAESQKCSNIGIGIIGNIGKILVVLLAQTRIHCGNNKRYLHQHRPQTYFTQWCRNHFSVRRVFQHHAKPRASQKYARSQRCKKAKAKACTSRCASTQARCAS